MKEFLSSRKFRNILWIAGGLAAVFLIFGLGATVGYHEAIFTSSWGQNYYKNFYGNAPGGPMEALTDQTPWNAHGATGSVIDVSSSTISIRDDDNDERSVEISSDTIIRKMDNTVMVDTINIGDKIAVIGEPNESGQVDARFIRVFDGSSSCPCRLNGPRFLLCHESKR